MSRRKRQAFDPSHDAADRLAATGRAARSAHTRRMHVRRLLATALLLGAGCSGSAGTRVEHAPASKVAASEPAPSSPAAQAEAPARSGEQAAAEPSPSPAGAEAAEQAALADAQDAGKIPRPALLAVLSAGIGRFLRDVRVEPRLDRGHFVGWRLLSLFPQSPVLQRASALRPGDVVLRVNGQSIERPEQFKDVWDSLATQSQLVLLVERGGKQGELRYRIVD